VPGWFVVAVDARHDRLRVVAAFDELTEAI
jgi:hypothetical protein